MMMESVTSAADALVVRGDVSSSVLTRGCNSPAASLSSAVAAAVVSLVTATATAGSLSLVVGDTCSPSRWCPYNLTTLVVALLLLLLKGEGLFLVMSRLFVAGPIEEEENEESC
jgi:hypothetical protein